jgi:prepilin-type N-terminal cleavage/methylation domain-containing protein/prepilin-type processing-associated H-X9-DG protein
MPAVTPAIPPASAQRKAFTLVELLVVIGIIAVLIGILLPALNSARRSAATTSCLSNLRQLAYAYQMYSGSNRGAFPVIRQDIPDPSFGVLAKSNLWWTDMLYPYALPGQKTVYEWTKPEEGAKYKKSVLWCPTWAITREEIDPFKNKSTDAFRTGYAPNQYPAFKPNYPDPDGLPPGKDENWRGNGHNGRYWKKAEMSDPANRILIADSTFWFIAFYPLKGTKDLPGQVVNIDTYTGGNGFMTIDRYRHGKYPRNDGTTYDTQGGQVRYNLLYVDGHATTSNDVTDAYRGIRMRYP